VKSSDFLQGNTVAGEKYLQVGDVAPEFTLPKADGELVSLADFRGRSDVVLFFYPKDNSPVCTAEACSFRDSYEVFRDAGAEVIGISADSSLSHEQFAARFRLPFVLLSDKGGVVRGRYGVTKTFGIFPGRTTYLIDREGVIRHIFSSQFLPTKHVTEALSVLKRVRGGS
jgi:thioredoxin-dependent peroxiredoxin